MLDIFAHILTGDIGGVLEIGNKEKISDFSGVFVFLMLMRFSALEDNWQKPIVYHILLFLFSPPFSQVSEY